MNYVIDIMIFLGSALMIYNIFGFIRFARRVSKEESWESWNGILHIPIALLIKFFLGYVAIVVCDINNLKDVNDTKGHSLGDHCICESSKTICKVFKHSPVFRIGGDEFAIILQNDDYAHRLELIDEINSRSYDNEENAGSTLAVGMSEYKKGSDESVLDVFIRADRLMY